MTGSRHALGMRRQHSLVQTVRYCIIIFWMIFTLLPIYTAWVGSLTEYENLGKTFLFPTGLACGCSSAAERAPQALRRPFLPFWAV